MNEAFKICRLKWCLIMMIAGISGLHAQTAVTVNFPSRNTTIENAFAQIERQTGYLISYKNTNFDLRTKVQLTRKQVTLTDALDQILNRTNRTYIFSDRNILIVPRVERRIPVYIPQPTQEEIDDIITEPEQFFRQEPEPPIVNLSGDQIPFHDPELDRTAYYAQRRIGHGRKGRAGYTAHMPTYALKVNLLYGVLAFAPNIGAEFGVAPKSTIDVAGGINHWKLKGTDGNNKKMTHWIVSAEYRYWFCERFNGHFLGGHAFFGYYNIAEHNMPLLFEKNSDQYRYKGNAWGLGISYGYHFMVGKKWNIELTAGVGFAQLHYDKWACSRCGDILERGKNRTYLGPTRAGVTLIYMIK